ncbi:PH domain-containing protein [Bacillus suaedae]|uniref:PH domain-containing protein n=1 Tax=Halalkalibacter suaedae TaxID=2822140 RepID=A0A941AQT8_9BACI|nr:PH domain-containing protein [Bacillus suaedae]MBP3951613.1 PH domain-containing protein [Bacillus suaedae]
MSEKHLENRLSVHFPKMRMISDGLVNLIVFVVLAGLFWLNFYFEWPAWAFWVLIALLVITIASTVWSLFEPMYLYRSWSYEYDEEYLQLKYGIFKKEWVTVPMTKIQSVSTVKGPIMKWFNTRSIKVETMGSSHSIPALDEEVALQLRETLAAFAKSKEVDES